MSRLQPLQGARQRAPAQRYPATELDCVFGLGCEVLVCVLALD